MGLLKKFCNLIWIPNKRKVEIYNYRINIFILILTVLAVFLAVKGYSMAYDQFILSFDTFNTQLTELNAKAKIDIKFKLASTTTLSIGPEIIEPPIEILINAHNSGKINTSNWDTVLYVCKDIKVLSYPDNWKNIQNTFYVYQSKDKIINEKMFFSPILDSIGKFKLIMPGKKYATDNLIPIAIFYSYGEKTKPNNMIVFFNISSAEFEYEKIEVDNGNVLTDVKGCFNVDSAILK